MCFMENEAIHAEVKNGAMKPPCTLTRNQGVTVSLYPYAKGEEGRVERAVLSESFKVDREVANDWNRLREQAGGRRSKRLMTDERRPRAYTWSDRGRALARSEVHTHVRVKRFARKS